MLENISSLGAQSTTTQLPVNNKNNVSGVSFKDVFDALNPLQHIPVVSNIYRYTTDTNISDGAKIAGDTLYGLATGKAVISAVASAADIAVKEVSGQDISGNVIQAVTGNNPRANFLVPNNNINTVDEDVNNQNFIPVNKQRSEIVAGQYSKALAVDSINKKLVKIVA